ncbi:MAG: serine--tRNA ligase [Candidatus Pacebacteria bacterium CG_4_10_14_0_8_um_filter_42_14]|nr:MAG: serine--tRNA ligase [Candidatus Pacebacteria bacterium CG_4_10_14_0_8_um_filter_42_14]
MLAISFIRENSEEVRQACRDKQLDPAVVGTLLASDEKRRALQGKVDDLRQQSNEHASLIKTQVQEGSKPTDEQIAKGKEIKTQLKEIEPELKAIEDEFAKLLLYIPNIPAKDVPVGPDESGNKVVRQVGKVPKLDFEPKPHQELLENLDLLDTKHAVKIGGFRSYFLKNDGLLLEQALLQYAMKKLQTEGFSPMSVPVLVNEETMWGTGYFPWGEEDHYKTQDNQFLAGTAEVALTAYYAGETLREKDLPIKMAGISPCFRREVGSYGKDTQGIIRVHQFNKVEMVVYTVADEEETSQWHEKMTGLSESLLRDLELSYQVLLMCTGDMGAGQRKKYDIETWFPSQNQYRETHSASYFNDFQSRRLDIKYQTKQGDMKHVYTLNNTMAASPRLLAAIVENYQEADGRIRVPKVLQQYLEKEMIG